MRRYPRPPPDAAVVEIEVPFHDVDALQVVWHGHYVKYMELARTALLRARGLDAPEMPALGYRFLVAETHLRHVRPLRYADRARVLAWLTGVENKIEIAYAIELLGSGLLCAQGATALVTVSDAGELCLETPQVILERLRAPATPPRPITGE